VLGPLPNRPSVDDDVEEDKVSEDALKKLGLLKNYFPTYLSTFLLVYSLAIFATFLYINVRGRSCSETRN